MMCANLIPINQTATTGYNVGGPWTLGVGGLWPSHLLFPERSCKMDPPIQCYHVRASPPPYSYFVRPWSDDHYNAIYLFIFLIQTPNQVSTCHAFTALPSHQHLWNSLPQLNGTLLRLSLRKSLRQLKQNTKFLNSSNLKLNHK